ncbi:MAG: Hsp70 family protein [Alphaproteobacteria bacterium]|nr:Hsp70 family protein [Alphaproteobacteria bacterium]
MTDAIEYGIDLGTTNSCVARLESGSIRIFQNNDQMNVTPSAVHIPKSGRVIVGRRAYAALLTDPDNVAIEFKRWMGQKDRKRFVAAQRDLSAEELSAEILKSLKEDVRRQSDANVTAAVITVPAAFGALQCEATARAAALAGLEEAPLLQEPIAAAIGYGLGRTSADQRWLVFDLGGGTLDIAVVSTRQGRLNILEHRGDNLLGGKDVDRLIVEQVLLPALEETYDLGSAVQHSIRIALLPQLRAKAEEAKIDLSTDERVIISLFDLGKDESGNLIDMEVPFSRRQLEALIEPLLEKCCSLADEALAGARITGGDLDRILLVGGPTQTPCVRSILKARFNTPVDFSIDPMTVVGRGAAVYASTLERTKKPAPTKAVDSSSILLKMAFEPVSAELDCIVAARVLNADSNVEIKWDAEGGHWTSGWMTPSDSVIEIPVPLKEQETTTFWIYARDSHGRLIPTEPSEFKVRHGLVPSAPPLPHTLSIEVLVPGGSPALDPVFSKGTPLPAEKKVKYRAIRPLIPGNANSNLAIKLWEGEFLDDPDANEWVGNVLLPHNDVRRTVPEGAEIEVTIRIDASRLINVEAFVPYLNQHFSSRLYSAQREEQNFSNLSSSVASEVQQYRTRLENLERNAANHADESVQNDLVELRRSVDELDAKAPSDAGKADPDDAKRVVEESKNVRGRLSRLERRAVSNPGPGLTSQSIEQVDVAEAVVEKFGSALEKQQLVMLRRELERALSKSDNRATQRICEEIDSLRWRVLANQDWFWRELFDNLRQPSTPYINGAEAKVLIAKGQSALATGDGKELREVVRALWKLQPKGNDEVVRERALRSGLRKF